MKRGWPRPSPLISPLHTPERAFFCMIIHAAGRGLDDITPNDTLKIFMQNIWRLHNFYYFCGMKEYNLDKSNVYPSKIATCRRQLSDWRVRLYNEFCTSSVSFFITLTISPDFLDQVSDDPTRCCQLFFKRLRRNMTSDYHKMDKSLSAPKFRYFLCSEFGEKRGRLHFHVLFFFENWISPAYFKQRLNKDWYYGFIKHKSLYDSRGIYYTTKYIGKKFIDDVVKLQSNGIGYNWFCKNAHLLVNKLFHGIAPKCFNGSFNVCIPRYYKKKLIVDDDIKQSFRELNQFENVNSGVSSIILTSMEYNRICRLCEDGFFPESYKPSFRGLILAEYADGLSHVVVSYDVPDVMISYFESNRRDGELLNDFKQKKYNYEEFRKRAHL